MSALPHAHLFRRYSTAGLANGAVDILRAAGVNARVVFRPTLRDPFLVESIRDQLRSAGQMLALCVVAFPPLFMLADWLRYGGV